MADWFSPSEIEAPTLESVGFYDRKTFQPLKIKEIPDIIYSEVMRDVDLAVSVAHVGGVDPETSHSTIEMRRAIIQCNLELFKISNVRLEESHAVIDGTLGQYTVHPVSYTHLDVYKRQALVCLGVREFNERKDVGQIVPWLTKSEIENRASSGKAVSYTHLQD